MSNTEFYCRAADGSQTAAGSTNSATPLVAATGGDWDATNRVYSFPGATDLSGVSAGMWASVYADGASVTGYVAEIASVDDGANTVTLHATRKSGTAPTTSTSDDRSIKIGGAWEGPNGADWFPFGWFQNTMVNSAGDVLRINFKNGTDYHVTAAGPTHSNAGPFIAEGFTTTAGDGGMAIITGDEETLPFMGLTLSGAVPMFRNMTFARNGLDVGVNTDGDQLVYCTGTCVSAHFYNCRFLHSWRDGLRLSGPGYRVEQCEFSACNVNAGNGFAPIRALTYGTVFRTNVHHTQKVGDEGDCLGMIIGSAVDQPVTVEECWFADNDGSGLQIVATNFNVFIKNCTFANNGHSGLRFQSASTGWTSFAKVENCLFSGNADYGIQYGSSTWGAWEEKNAFYDNDSGQTTGGIAEMRTGAVTLTASAFVDATNGDFNLNNTASAGAACRNAGSGAFLMDSTYSETTVSYVNIGAASPLVTSGAASFGPTGSVIFN